MDPNCDFAEDGGSLLMLTIKEPDVVKLLLDREDIDVNKQDNRGHTALSYVVQYVTPSHAIEPAKLLLDRDDIDVNLPSRCGETPLHIACCSAVDRVDLLLKKEGVDVNASDIHGCTPLGTCCYLHHEYRKPPKYCTRLIYILKI